MPMMTGDKPVVLIIEDERPIRRFVRAALEDEGCLVYEAETASVGLAQAVDHKPDLVILDLGLPDNSRSREHREGNARSVEGTLSAGGKMSKKFMHVSIAILCLALAYHFGASNAVAQARRHSRRNYDRDPTDQTAEKPPSPAATC